MTEDSAPDPSDVAHTINEFVHDLNNMLGVALGQTSLARAAADMGSDPTRAINLSLEALNEAVDISRRLATFAHGLAPRDG